MEISIPYGHSEWKMQVDSQRIRGILTPCDVNTTSKKENAIIQEAMDCPIGSARLSELAKRKKNVVIIASDHTRAVPSRLLAPRMCKEIREGNPDAEITFLVATGFHRQTTREELIQKFGKTVVEKERILVHDASLDAQMVSAGTLPSGGELKINRLAMEADLLVAEGLIEPHLFAGFSGGRKSVLPGIVSRDTVMANHCAEFIAHPNARPGVLKGNPIHEDMMFAAKTAGLTYIVNVILDREKRVIDAVAGDWELAHQEGCLRAGRLAEVKAQEADIVITGNGGYPLDQNVYQHVKAATSAEACVRPGGVIILCGEIGDGHGSEAMYRSMKEGIGPLMEKIRNTPRNQTQPDQWAAQIFGRILEKHPVIFATADGDRDMLRKMGFLPAASLSEALRMAEEFTGKEAGITVIPDGVSVIVKGGA